MICLERTVRRTLPPWAIGLLTLDAAALSALDGMVVLELRDPGSRRVTSQAVGFGALRHLRGGTAVKGAPPIRQGQQPPEPAAFQRRRKFQDQPRKHFGECLRLPSRRSVPRPDHGLDGVLPEPP